ncbi:unnamed protein product [Trifolium pratense]|uniref:Uncharacterized protein n=1 Tax=Trifolium pratense TaxID=57577 RepID=A0ACB0IME3_TRIPR|nr:unnamed protein product [Trifolium pratense]
MDYLQQLQIKFLLQFSLFCVLFLPPLLLYQNLKLFLMQFSIGYYTIDKSYMFIICNVLLAIIIFYSTIFNSIDDAADNYNEWLEYNVSKSKIEDLVATESIMETESHETKNVVIDTEEEENSLMITDEDQEMEEFNKKCEDFIKKMKASFCYETRAYYSDYYQKSLVIVN